MSALLPMHGPLPAAAMALAMAAASPDAAHAGDCVQVRAPKSGQPDSLKAIRDSLDRQTFNLLRWVAELQTGLDDAAGMLSDIGRLVETRTERLKAGVSLMAAWADARMDDMASAAGETGRDVADAIGAGQMTAFALRAGARIPSVLPASARAGAEAAVMAALQPIYDTVDAFRAIEAKLVLSARRAALKADIQAMAKRNFEIVRLAKAELLRVVAETAKLAFVEIPPREARAMVRDAVLTLPIDASAPRPFGKRIDYPGLANRWITGP